MNIQYASINKKGQKDINEDSVLYMEKNNSAIFILADGLGGHDKGNIASLTAATLSIALFDSDEYSGCKLLNECFTSSQQEILMLQQVMNDKKSMKSTMVILLITDEDAIWGHVGDSRLYVFRDNTLYGRTIDHSVPQALCLAGEIAENEIRHHADRHLLLKALGAHEKLKYNLSEGNFKLEKGDAFLLCSDGFWEWIDEVSMCNCLKQTNDPDHWLELMEMVIETNAKGQATDDCSAVAVIIQ